MLLITRIRCIHDTHIMKIISVMFNGVTISDIRNCVYSVGYVCCDESTLSTMCVTDVSFRASEIVRWRE